jgi:ubiquinone/menaquinone biosynthesis C-methylase UbiE
MNYNVVDFRRRILGKVNLNLSSNDMILDIGCGSGADAEFFSEKTAKVLGLDLKVAPSWSQARKDNMEFLIADGLNLPLVDNTFDIVFEKDALHHIARSGHAQALREMVRVTKVGGKIIVVEANRYEPIAYLHMVLIKRHDHFPKKHLKEEIASISSDANIRSVQSRVWPIKTGRVLRMIHVAEDLLERIPLVRDFLNYNIVLIEKKRMVQ